LYYVFLHKINKVGSKIRSRLSMNVIFDY